MAAALQFFATNNQYAYPAPGVQYSVGFPAFGVTGIPGPVGRYFAQRVEPNPIDLGAFDTAADAIAACQADYNALPPPSS